MIGQLEQATRHCDASSPTRPRAAHPLVLAEFVDPRMVPSVSDLGVGGDAEAATRIWAGVGDDGSFLNSTAADLDGRVPTVDDDLLSREVARRVGGEKIHEPGQILRRCHPALWNPSDPIIEKLWFAIDDLLG